MILVRERDKPLAEDDTTTDYYTILTGYYILYRYLLGVAIVKRSPHLFLDGNENNEVSTSPRTQSR